VNAGDRLALQELRDTLHKYTWMSSVMGGNLAYQAETSLVNTMYGDQFAAKEALQRELEKKRAELSGQNSTPIERIDYNQRRQDRSHRRFLAAVKTLATVRRLALPIRVDVNLATMVNTNLR